MTKPQITLLHHTPLEVCSHAIRTCWSSFDKGDCGGEKDRELINRVGNIYKHACYDGGTELLTKNGWKKIGDIDIGESVMTMQKDSKYGIPAS